MSSVDLYAVLGVLPDAEDIVITAAYRALAQRYHPDKWKGDPDEAHRRMSELNNAYAVLGDASRRAAYDRTRKQTDHAEFGAENNEYQSEAFRTALDEVEDRWTTACGIFSDLKELRARLSKISSSLAFAFVTGLLETKAFTRRAQMAEHLEQVFLERYFGTNVEVLDYARQLILGGQKEAARALNRLVDVMGSDVDAALLIDRIAADFGLAKSRKSEKLERLRKAGAEKLANRVYTKSIYFDARELATALNYSVEDVGSTLFRVGSLHVTSPTNQKYVFKDTSSFVAWVREAFCVPP